MSSYHIIDEPKVKLAERFIINPMFILLAGMLIPMFFSVPLYGRFWLPFVWLAVNGYLLGSPTFLRELLYACLGVVAIFAIFTGFGYLIKTGVVTTPQRFFPYIRVAVSAVFFIALYLAVFTQSVPFSIYEYVKGQRHE